MVATLEGSLSEPMTSADEDGNSVDSEVSALRSAITNTSTLVSGMSAREAPDWMWNYNLMAILVGVNHGVEDLFFAYTTVVYPGRVGYNANTLLYLVWCFSSMLLAAPVSTKLGSKTVIVLGLVFYDIQYIMFVICSFLDDSWLLEAVAYTGAIACGIGAGFLWTAEGVYFAQSTQRVADATGETLKAKSAQLAALFGLWSLGIETAVKLSSYALETMGPRAQAAPPLYPSPARWCWRSAPPCCFSSARGLCTTSITSSLARLEANARQRWEPSRCGQMQGYGLSVSRLSLSRSGAPS